MNARARALTTLAAALLTSAPALACWAEPGPAKRPAVLELKRPQEGEWYGLYVLSNKAGYAFSQIREEQLDGKPCVLSVTEVALSAKVGGVPTQRRMREEHFYEYKDGGRLIRFRIERSGDGGDEVLLGRLEGQGFEVLRKRPGRPDETSHFPAVRETLDMADAPRLALARGAPLDGFILDADDVSEASLTTTLLPSSTLTAGGITVPVKRARSIETKDHIPMDASMDAEGRVLEIRYGDVMVAKAEPEEKAKAIDQVDLFALTRVVLDKPLPPALRKTPGEIRWRIQGLPPERRMASGRQVFKALDGAASELLIKAKGPSTHVSRPVAFPVAFRDDKAVAEALKANLAVESEDPAIQAAARKIAGNEKDAFEAAKKLAAWVASNLKKRYGASSDRATDVLMRLEGDCTEHSLLFVSFARALGIPARRLDGLVYMEAGDGVPALYWHEWAEVYVGEWVAIDPTFNQPVADATHIALGSEGRAESAALIGQLKISLAQ